MTVAPFIFWGMLAYFIGSSPTGFLWAKARGIDIRTVGSGNIGATMSANIDVSEMRK